MMSIQYAYDIVMAYRNGKYFNIKLVTKLNSNTADCTL